MKKFKIEWLAVWGVVAFLSLVGFCVFMGACKGEWVKNAMVVCVITLYVGMMGMLISAFRGED